MMLRYKYALTGVSLSKLGGVVQRLVDAEADIGCGEVVDEAARPETFEFRSSC